MQRTTHKSRRLPPHRTWTGFSQRQRGTTNLLPGGRRPRISHKTSRSQRKTSHIHQRKELQKRTARHQRSLHHNQEFIEEQKQPLQKPYPQMLLFRKPQEVALCKRRELGELQQNKNETSGGHHRQQPLQEIRKLSRGKLLGVLQRSLEDLEHFLPLHRKPRQFHSHSGPVSALHVRQRRQKTFETHVLQRSDLIPASIGAEIQRGAHDIGACEPQEAGHRRRRDYHVQVRGVRGGGALGGIDAAAEGHQERNVGDARVMDVLCDVFGSSQKTFEYKGSCLVM